MSEARDTGPGPGDVNAGLPAQLLTQLRSRLEADRVRLSAEVRAAAGDLDGLLRQTVAGEAADEADVGAHLAGLEQQAGPGRNVEELLEQTLAALDRIAEGSYGTCADCGAPIGAARLEAFPRATLCLPCRVKTPSRR